jgi:hypothetical protein
MRNFRTPGVYIRDLEVKPPRRVRMDVTGFVGQAERGPLNFPQPLTSWGEYLDIYGGFVGYGYLPYSVFTFFGNGGDRCYVVRVAHESAGKAAADLVGPPFVVTDQSLARLKADGVPEGVVNKLEAIKGQEFQGVEGLASVLEQTIGAEQAARFKARLLERAGRPLIRVEAINEGAWAGVTGEAGRDGVEVVAESYSTDDLVLTELAEELPPRAAGVKLKSVAGLRGDIEGEVEGDRVKLLHPVFPTRQEQAAISEVRPDQSAVVFEGAAGNDFAAGTRVLGKGFKLTFRHTRDGQLVRGEVFDNLSVDPAHDRYFVRVINGDPEEPDYIKRVRDGSSILVRVTDLCQAATLPCPRIPDQTLNLSGGRDGDPARVGVEYFTGYRGAEPHQPFPSPAPLGQEDKLYGLAAYEAVEEIGIVAIPDLILPDLCDAVPKSLVPEQGLVFAAAPRAENRFERLKEGQAHMLLHCQRMGERSAILDSPRGAELGRGGNKIEEWPSNFQLMGGAKYGALYYPWLVQKAADFGGLELLIPPCGAVAGVYARSEQARGVGKAPANEILRGAVELEFCLDDEAQSLLNPKGVNCLRIFPGRGLRVWGARTLSPDPLSVYVNVRRVVLSVIKNLLVNLRWTVFEPNDQQLRAAITGNLRVFFTGLFQSGALAGASPKEAFFVKCDEENNPPEVVALGQAVTEIGFAPERPAEFVLVTIKRSPGALSVLER